MKPMAHMVFNQTGEFEYHVFADHNQAQDHADNITQASPDPAFEAEVIPLFAISLAQVQALQQYAKANGPLHDDNCPGDDTCTCSRRDTNDFVNALCGIEFLSHLAPRK